MERYKEYKDSGVQWLGNIPSHWEIRRTKYLWQETDRRSEFGSEQLLSVSQYDGVREAQTDSRSESLKGYKKVKQENLVINIMLAWLGGLGVSKHEGIVSPAYCVYKLLDAQNPRYLHYLYRTPLYLAEFARHSTGIVPSRWRMYTDDFGEVLTILPPIEEQNRMVAYLDEAISKIDEAIAQQQRMIDLLNERKQIVINNAVTKGLEPNTPIKDSGVDYIGLFPSSWVIRRVSSLGKFAKGGNITRDNLQDEGKPAILYGDIYTKYNISANEINNHVSAKVAAESVRIYNGDLLMTGSGETKEDIGKTIVFEGEEAYIGGDVILFRQSSNNSKFLSYALNSQYAKDFRYRESKGEIVVHIYANAIRRLYLAIPNVKEQNIIVEYLDKNMAIIDSDIEIIQQKITLLQERKQIIINDVVTGKVKVI